MAPLPTGRSHHSPGFDVLGFALLTLAAAACSPGAKPAAQSAGDELDRTSLPIREPTPAVITTLDARNAKAPPRFQVTAPKGAPNVIIFLIDDIGFGDVATFGGAINTPTLDRLAASGLRYNRFHTTALCSPTRVAILTGHNHHSNNAGAIMEIATAFPGNTGVRPQSITPMAEILRENGYSTAAFGKYHETPPWEVSPSGPYDRWPTHSGFDKFYGFIGGETNQWSPLIFDGTIPLPTPHTPGYHFTVDMADQAIAWTRAQHTLTPDRPFFIYFATGATHAPHQVPKEWIDKYKGKFDGGWDKYREETLARQIKLGIVPAGTKLAPKPAFIKDWDKLPPEQKRLFAHQMEVFAGFAEQTDYEIGRVIKAVEEMGALDNTLILYEVGDNGASAEGGDHGVLNEMAYFNGIAEPIEQQLKHIDELGGPNSYGHFAAAWAVAGNTPFEWTKQVASNFGGTRNPLVISWPARIKAKGEIRSQFHHVVDIEPTVLEAARIPEPKTVNGIAQAPIEGVSMVYTFDNASAADQHKTQYFEMFGNRAIYHDGWVAGTVHKAPWEAAPRHPLDQDVWELYDVSKDFSESTDLAASNPDKLKELQALFLSEAAKYKVLPIDDRSIERLNAEVAGRPDLMGTRTSLTVYPGMKAMMEAAFITVKNRSVKITAEVEIPAGGANGVILAQGGKFGGWSLYLKNGRPAYTYNFLGYEEYTTLASKAVAPGHATIVMDFAYAGGGRAKGGTVTISVNGTQVATGTVKQTQPGIFSVDDAADVGEDEGTPVSSNYPQFGNEFTGTIDKVTVDVGPLGEPAQAASEPE